MYSPRDEEDIVLAHPNFLSELRKLLRAIPIYVLCLMVTTATAACIRRVSIQFFFMCVMFLVSTNAQKIYDTTSLLIMLCNYCTIYISGIIA